MINVLFVIHQIGPLRVGGALRPASRSPSACWIRASQAVGAPRPGRDDTFLSGRSEIILRLIGSPVDTRETFTNGRKKLTNGMTPIVFLCTGMTTILMVTQTSSNSFKSSTIWEVSCSERDAPTNISLGFLVFFFLSFQQVGKYWHVSSSSGLAKLTTHNRMLTRSKVRTTDEEPGGSAPYLPESISPSRR
ncbi:hypothetical protein NE237_019816 [Protea cynaroides]|uniref:Uncharacterized protein n=1 Tax=Protea cynaroides TaxID=273540 RepID=A0A9Q0H788_9MAGN|nr:hypothetical protein NE237_019816 [Protea cynaroides]